MGDAVGDLTVEPTAVGTAATTISRCASRLSGAEFTSTFTVLTGAFIGATQTMSDVAGSGDNSIRTAMVNASGTVSAFSELVAGFKNTTVEQDAQAAKTIRSAIGDPR